MNIISAAMLNSKRRSILCWQSQLSVQLTVNMDRIRQMMIAAFMLNLLLQIGAVNALAGVLAHFLAELARGGVVGNVAAATCVQIPAGSLTINALVQALLHGVSLTFCNKYTTLRPHCQVKNK